MGRIEPFSLLDGCHWDKNAIIWVFSFIFIAQRENGFPFTHPPWQSPAKFVVLNEPCGFETCWDEEAALLLEPPSPPLAGFTFTYFFNADQFCLDNDTVKTHLSITCTSSAQSDFIWWCCGLTVLCIPLSVPLGDACCPLFCAWSGPRVSDYVRSFWELIQTKLKVLV